MSVLCSMLCATVYIKRDN